MGSASRQVLNAICQVVLIFGPQHCLGTELPDPTRPLEGYVATPGERRTANGLPVLKSVLVGSDRRVVIIDGKRYKKNDRIGSYRLVSIKEDQVTLEDGKNRLQLRLAIVRTPRVYVDE